MAIDRVINSFFKYLFFTYCFIVSLKIVRKLWKEYFFAVDAIVFIIDVSKSDRFLEAKTELNAILESEQMAECPILVLGNKIDKQTEFNLNEDYIKNYFNLNTTGKVIF